jgi:hypothetical protein
MLKKVAGIAMAMGMGLGIVVLASLIEAAPGRAGMATMAAASR